jgi:hypothetical protein
MHGRLERLDDGRWGARDAAGWHVCLDNLAAHLEGEEPAWQAVHPEYIERFGREAATIGPL